MVKVVFSHSLYPLPPPPSCAMREKDLAKLNKRGKRREAGGMDQQPGKNSVNVDNCLYDFFSLM